MRDYVQGFADAVGMDRQSASDQIAAMKDPGPIAEYDYEDGWLDGLMFREHWDDDLRGRDDDGDDF